MMVKSVEISPRVTSSGRPCSGVFILSQWRCFFSPVSALAHLWSWNLAGPQPVAEEPVFLALLQPCIWIMGHKLHCSFTFTLYFTFYQFLKLLHFAKWRGEEKKNLQMLPNMLIVCFPWSEVQSMCQHFLHFPLPKFCHLFSALGEILTVSSRAFKISITVIFGVRILNITIKSSFCVPQCPAQAEGFIHWMDKLSAHLSSSTEPTGLAWSIAGLFWMLLN